MHFDSHIKRNGNQKIEQNQKREKVLEEVVSDVVLKIGGEKIFMQNGVVSIKVSLHNVANSHGGNQKNQEEYEVLVDEMLARRHFASRYFAV